MLEEFELTVGVFLELVQQLHGLPDLVHLIAACLHRLAMVVVALEMEYVSLQLILSFLLALFTLSEVIVFLLAVFIQVARVIATGFRSVLLPWRKA